MAARTAYSRLLALWKTRCLLVAVLAAVLPSCGRDWSYVYPGPRDASSEPASDAASVEASGQQDASSDALMDESYVPEASQDAAAEDGSACSAGERRCASESPEACENGQWKAEAACNGATPHCSGAGQCVACTQDAHCAGNGPCAIGTCNAQHECSLLPSDAGIAASPGEAGTCMRNVCDGDGGTVQVYDPANADDGNPCTLDACADGGAVHASLAGQPCGLNGECDTQDSCVEAVQGCGDIRGLRAGSPWPMSEYCPTHPGRSPYVGPKTLAIKYSSAYLSGSWGGWGVQAADDAIFVAGSTSTRLFKLTGTASKVWDHPGGTGAPCLALGADGTVYATTLSDYSNAALVAIKPGAAGATDLWSYPAGAATATCPVVGGDGTIYIGAGQDCVAVRSDGSQKWRVPTGGRIEGGMSITLDGTILCTSHDKKLYALDPADGAMKGAYAAGGEITTAAVIAPDGTIYFGSKDKSLYALTPSLAKKGQFVTGGQVATPALGHGGRVFFGSWDLYMYAVEWEAGSLVKKWDKALCGTPRSGTIVDKDGTVYVGGMDWCDRLYALNPLDGTELSHVDGTGSLSGISSQGWIVATRSTGAGQFRVHVVADP